MNKRNLLVTVSAGESSLYMAQWLWENKKEEYNMVFVFANTGQEREESIKFLLRCEANFGFKIHYIESVVHHKSKKSSTYIEVPPAYLDFSGKVFEGMIKKYGIPNKAYPHCTRELKNNPIKWFAKDYFKGESYLLALGIREDEMDRVNPKYKEFGIIYPLITMRRMTKAKINFWWSQQHFRLELKGYEGNCSWCWKKSDKKLYLIAIENKEAFDFPMKMEEKYKFNKIKKGVEVQEPKVFFRGKRSTIELLEYAESIKDNLKVKDENDIYDPTESCEIFSNCGDF